MSDSCYIGRIERTGPGDIVAFRDCVLSYCAALRKKCPFHCQADAEAQELLKWLGVEVSGQAQQGVALVDPSRGSGFDRAVSLVSGESLPRTSLAELRDRGYLGVTLFAALVRSSYGPDEPGYFPTQSELGFYFDEELLLQSQVLWDSGYLDECQEFFFEELTPAELLDLSLASLPAELGLEHKRFRSELLGVAFLIGESTTTLIPLTQFLQRVLTPSQAAKELQALIAKVPEWDQEAVSQAWDQLPEPHRSVLIQDLLEPVGDQASDVLVACGRDLLEWRARL